MAQAVFFFCVEFSHGLTQFGEKEDWIISESIGSPFYRDDLSFAKPGDNFFGSSWCCDGYCGAEAR